MFKEIDFKVFFIYLGEKAKQTFVNLPKIGM